MSTTFESVLLSRPFKFIIGPEETPLFVHEAAIAAQSRALSALVRGGMSESQAGEAKWEDIDEGTFARFVEFAYSSDYHVPLSEDFDVESDDAEAGSVDGEDQARSNPPLPDPVPEPDTELDAGPAVDWGTLGTFAVKERKNGFSLPLPTPPAFASLQYPIPTTTTIFTQLSAGKGYHMDNTLLPHASLYALAEKWGIDTLKQLALSKLHRQLVAFDLSDATVPDLVGLIRYSYLHTPDLEEGADELRELVCQYVANHSVITGEHPEFSVFLEEGGSFVSDLWVLVSTRVRTT